LPLDDPAQVVVPVAGEQIGAICSDSITHYPKLPGRVVAVALDSGVKARLLREPVHAVPHELAVRPVFVGQGAQAPGWVPFHLHAQAALADVDRPAPLVTVDFQGAFGDGAQALVGGVSEWLHVIV